jgi:transposase
MNHTITATPTLQGHYEQLLGLVHPWKVETINLDMELLKLIIHVAWEQGIKAPCPVCNTLCALENHREVRSWRHLDTMQFETIITAKIPRISCKDHGAKSIPVPWAGAYSRFTTLFERFAIDVIKGARNLTKAKELLRLSWDQIHAIQQRAVERGLSRRTNELIEHAGIDEKNFGQGHSYVSLLTDLDRSRVMDVVRDRTQEAAETLWNTLSEAQRATITSVAMDMWEAFMNATKKIAPHAEIVHDKFHTVSYLTKAVDEVRRKENSTLVKAGNDLLKGTKYLWLKNPKQFGKDEQDVFRSFALDQLKVGKAWTIKEAFQAFWNYSYQGSATTFFNRWYFWATHSRLKPMIEAAKTLKRHLIGLLAYIKHRITNAVTEGLNSIIQSIKANARGFRNFENYRTAILFHCGKLNLYP